MINYPTLVAYTSTAADWLLALMSVLCVLAHLACLRSPDVQEPPTNEMGRRIKIAGFTVISVYWLMRLTNGGYAPLNTPLIIGLTVVFIGELIIALVRLYEHRFDFIPEKYMGKERRKPVVAKVVTTVTVLDSSRVDAISTVVAETSKNVS